MTYHSLQCPNCHGAFLLTLEQSHQLINQVSLELIDCPTLRCPDCGYYTLPDRIRSSLNRETARAAEQSKTEGTVRFQNQNRRFNFCQSVEFIYDYRDYLYLPGLFRGDGFLTPVFFHAHVLHKYRNTPGYRVEMPSDSYGTVYFRDGGYLPFGVNRRGEVIAWLGDIDGLPLTEQHYLRSENIESSHDIASEFYDGQIDVIFTELSKEQQLFSSRAEFIRSTKTSTGADTALLDAEATAILGHFSSPLDEGRRSISEAFLDLRKVCIETISREAFARDLARRGIIFDRKWGSLKILQCWAEKVLGRDDSPQMLSPLFVLDDLRKLEAHLVGSSTSREILETACKRLGIKPDSNLRTIYDTLIIRLHAMYEQLVDATSRLV